MTIFRFHQNSGVLKRKQKNAEIVEDFSVLVFVTGVEPAFLDYFAFRLST